MASRYILRAMKISPRTSGASGLAAYLARPPAVVGFRLQQLAGLCECRRGTEACRKSDGERSDNHGGLLPYLNTPNKRRKKPFFSSLSLRLLRSGLGGLALWRSRRTRPARAHDGFPRDALTARRRRIR